MALDKIRLAHSQLTDSIFLIRHGKDPALALEKRPAENDVFNVLVQHMMHKAPNGSERVVTDGDRQYVVRVTPV